MTQGTLSRRMTGEVEFGVDLVDRVCEATGISFVYVTTGIRETPAGPNGPDGGPQEVRPERLELPTFCSQGQNAQASDLTAPRLVAVSSQAAA